MRFFNSARVHFMGKAMAHAGKSCRSMDSAFIGTAFTQEDAQAARAQWRRVADQLRPKLPKQAGFLDEAETDVLASMSFPTAPSCTPQTLELLNGEIKRRTGRAPYR
jgi:transposase-like protein